MLSSSVVGVDDDTSGFWIGILGIWCWLFGVPRPFVRPGHPHPSPLPPSGRGDPAFAGMTQLGVFKRLAWCSGGVGRAIWVLPSCWSVLFFVWSRFFSCGCCGLVLARHEGDCESRPFGSLSGRFEASPRSWGRWTLVLWAITSYFFKKFERRRRRQTDGPACGFDLHPVRHHLVLAPRWRSGRPARRSGIGLCG